MGVRKPLGVSGSVVGVLSMFFPWISGTREVASISVTRESWTFIDLLLRSPSDVTVVFVLGTFMVLMSSLGGDAQNSAETADNLLERFLQGLGGLVMVAVPLLLQSGMRTMNPASYGGWQASPEIGLYFGVAGGALAVIGSLTG